MIAEDELSIQRIYKILLTSSGFDVIGMAKNGEEAVNMYKSFLKKPDIIIMDHRMPLKDGIEATREILQIDKNAKIIFASADITVEKLAISSGALSFKIKPFDNDCLINNIKKTLGIEPFSENVITPPA